MLNFLVVVILAIVSRTIPQTVFYLLGFLPLRQIAGGYHAKTHFRCLLILIFSYTVFLLLLHFAKPVWMLPAIITGIVTSIVLVFIFAPAADSNKPISKQEAIDFKRKSRITIAVYGVIVGLLTVFIPNKVFAFSLVCGVFTVAVSLLASFIKYESRK